MNVILAFISTGNEFNNKWLLFRPYFLHGYSHFKVLFMIRLADFWDFRKPKNLGGLCFSVTHVTTSKSIQEQHVAYDSLSATDSNSVEWCSHSSIVDTDIQIKKLGDS